MHVLYLGGPVGLLIRPWAKLGHNSFSDYDLIVDISVFVIELSALTTGGVMFYHLHKIMSSIQSVGSNFSCSLTVYNSRAT